MTAAVVMAAVVITVLGLLAADLGVLLAVLISGLFTMSLEREWLEPELLIPEPTGLDLLTVAFHESSHSISIWHYGWKFVSVEINENGRSGLLTPTGGIRPSLSYAITCISGPVGEARYCGTPWEEIVLDAGASDLAMTREVLASLGDAAPTLYDVALRADAILRTHWRLVQRVAFALAAPPHRLEHDAFLRVLSRW